jgi:exosortase
LKRLPWVAWAWFGALLLLSYAPVLWRLVRQWDSDPDMGHGFFVPLVVGYIVWQKRAELLALEPAPNWWGLAVVIYGGLQLWIATLGAELFLARTAFVISVIGVVLLLGGTAWVRALAFPLFLLFFMIPIPAVVYNSITFPLQLLASRVSTQALDLMQIPVLREGNVLELAEQKLSVVEACSGIRSLLSLTFLSLVYGYFFESKAWMRVVLFVSTIPIAIVANASRVTLTGVLTEYKPELAEGFFHTASGWVIFMVALAIMVVLHQILNWGYRVAHGRG